MTKTDRVLSSFLRAVLLRMKALGLNQTQLAKRLKVARPYVTKVLQGDVNISFMRRRSSASKGTRIATRCARRARKGARAACRLAKALEMDFIPTLAPKEGTSESVRSEE